MTTLEQLDKIAETLSPDQSTFERADGLMSAYVRTSADLDSIARRYSTSDSPAIQAALAATLARTRWLPGFESTSDLVFSIADRFHADAYWGTLCTLFGSIEYEVVRLTEQAPTSVVRLLNDVLRSRGYQALPLWDCAMNLLEGSAACGTLRYLFAGGGELQGTASELRTIAGFDSSVKERAVSLADVLEKLAHDKGVR